MRVSGCLQLPAYLPEDLWKCRKALAKDMHLDVFDRGDAKIGSRCQLQREKDVVVVADDPPQPGIAQVAMGEQIDAVALDDCMQAVVVPGRGVDPLSPAKIFLGFMKHRQFTKGAINHINGFRSILRLDINLDGCTQTHRCVWKFPQYCLRAEYLQLRVI